MRVSQLYLLTILALSLISAAAFISTRVTPSYTERTITVNHTGYKNLTDMAESTKMILVGTVTQIKSTTGPSVESPTTKFEVRIDKWLNPLTASNFTTATVIQIGSRDSTGSAGTIDDPLMKVGEQNVFFLFDGEGDGTQKPYSTTGEWGRFRVQDGEVHPINHVWQEYDGMNLDTFIDLVNYKPSRQALIIIGIGYSEMLNSSTTLQVVREWKEGQLTDIPYVVNNETLFDSLRIGTTYNVTYHVSDIPQLGRCYVILEAKMVPYESGTLGTNPHHIPFLGPVPIGPTAEEAYGPKVDLKTAAAQWKKDRGEPLLQPTWLPEGLTQTSVSAQWENPTTQTGKLKEVTILYSFSGIDDPFTAELQLRVMMPWSTTFLSPRWLRDNVNLGGNYTELDGRPRYIGIMGWFDGGYFEMYGGTTLVHVYAGRGRRLLLQGARRILNKRPSEDCRQP